MFSLKQKKTKHNIELPENLTLDYSTLITSE